MRLVAPVVTVALALLVGRAEAHFVLQQPKPMFEQGPLGDPQKAPPCGDDGDAVLTDNVTTFHPGDTITIKIKETIPHPGHYRVALAVNDPSELPEEPIVTAADGDPCDSAAIMDPPAFPVLADGMLKHTSMFTEPQEFEVTLPDDVTCEHCTLQVIEFMSNHGLNNPGGCFYHHCATIAILADDVALDSDDTDAGADDGEGCSCATSPAGGVAVPLLVGLALLRRRRS